MKMGDKEFAALLYDDPILRRASEISWDQPKQAIKLCDDFVKNNPSGAVRSAILIRKQAHQRLEDWPEALDDANALVNLEPDRYYHYYSRGEALYHLGQNRAAATDFDRAAELDTNHIKSEMSLYYAALCYYHSGDYATAIARCRTIPPGTQFPSLDKFEPDGPLQWLMKQIESAQRGEPHKF